MMNKGSFIIKLPVWNPKSIPKRMDRTGNKDKKKMKEGWNK